MTLSPVCPRAGISPASGVTRNQPRAERPAAVKLTGASEALDTTIVWVSGEFGRTPKVQWEAPWNGGRGHYGKAFSALVAGGGFKGGTVVGKTDERGETVVERPIYPWDLLGSMYALLGIDPRMLSAEAGHA